MKKWFMRLKVLTVLCAVAAVTTDFTAQVQENKSASTTLSASGDVAAAAGIKTYRISKPKRSAADPDFVVLEVELLDGAQMKVGRWSERSKGAGDSRLRHTELEFQLRRIAMTTTARSVRLVVDGQEIYNGPFAPADPATAAKISSLGDLLKVMDAISRDVEKARHGAEKLSSDWARVPFVPQGLKPLAISLVRWLPSASGLFSITVFAEEGGRIRCPTNPDDHTYCEFGEGAVRSTACEAAQTEANGECSDWILCIGCCSFAAPGDGCDCACLVEDFICSCVACGARCYSEFE